MKFHLPLVLLLCQHTSRRSVTAFVTNKSSNKTTGLVAHRVATTAPFAQRNGICAFSVLSKTTVKPSTKTTQQLFTTSESTTTTTTSSTSTRLYSTPPKKEEVDPGVVEGTDLRIVKYPHPSLRETNAEVTQEEIKDGSIAKLAKEMFLVMYAAEGIGLAAPQVGVNKRLMVYNESGDRKRWLDETVMINPKIVEFSSAKDVEFEACLSFPDMNGEVERPKWIKVEALSLKGRKIKKKFTGWEARLFQHEYDHLDGVVYIDRLTDDGRSKVQPKLDELIQDHGPGGAL